MKNILFFLFLSIIFFGCGYKPTYLYTKKVMGDNIFVDVDVSLVDPQNSVLIADAMREAVISKFHSNLTSKDKAESTMKVYLNSISFRPIQYDSNGYVIAYKTIVGLRTVYKDKNGHTKVINSTGDYDFSIEANSVISDNKRFEAIRFASIKAMDELISKISIAGRKEVKNE